MILAPRTLAALAVAGLLFAGCSAPATVDTGSPAGTNRPATSKAAATDKETTEAPAQEDGTAAFGSTYTWDDGISISVSKPKVYKPSEYVDVDKGTTPMLMTVTLVNNSSEPFDPVMVSLSAQSGNEEASQIFDSAKKVEGSPSTKVLKGREVSFKVAFAVSDPKDIVVEASPDFLHDSVIFAS